VITRFTRLITIGIIAMAACTDQEMNVKENESSKVNTDVANARTATPDYNPFNKTTGAPIEENKAQQWIDNYKTANPGCERNYLIKSGAIKTIIQNKKSVGISLFYGVDSYRKIHILPIGIDEKGKQIQSKYISTQRGDIPWKTAQQWISNYTGTTRSHFFGLNTFSRLWENGVTDISISFARDDNNNAQLLLSSKTAAGANRKVAAKKDYEDASAACPPACPK
jgi:hypothetical protein